MRPASSPTQQELRKGVILFLFETWRHDAQSHLLVPADSAADRPSTVHGPPVLEVSISIRPYRGQVAWKAKSPSRTRDAKHCQIRTLSLRRRAERNGWL